VVAGLLATQGVFNLTGAASSFVYLPRVLRGLEALPRLDVTSVTNAPPVQGSPGSTTIFPPPFPPVSVVVVPLGPTRVVLILPIPNITHFPFPSNSHPVQPETNSQVSLPAPSPNALFSFGQIATDETLACRISRFGSEPEVAALIDVVEPFQVPAPANLPNKAAAPLRTGTTVMLSPGLLQIPPQPEGENRGVEDLAAILACSNPTAVLIGRDGSDDESPTASAIPSLAVVAVTAGAGYRLTFRDDAGRKPGFRASRFGRKPLPRVQRFSLPPM
jgi:hypothetical protein